MNIQNTKKRFSVVAIMNAVHDLPVLVARDQGFFRDRGLGHQEFRRSPRPAWRNTQY